ncbi:hypothetical protein SBOR_1651 [Sclerotinia borealis F-4128]|uniref:Uncharacterized protein n=1 Tax=Sclerotinia borealis (strain F-4128) TaxID=1432307 RepID=W9CTZ6_SCLBF|nr:hypothetical protein SBOR_1651 [Sclerotinia borealis F-4128]
MSPQFTNNVPIDDDLASLVSSQDSVTAMDFVKRANQMMADTKKRRDAKRNKIEDDRAKRIKDAKKKLEELYDSRRTQRKALQKAQWKRLDSMNKRRQELESHILASMTTIEHSTLNMVRELNTVLIGRLKSMEDLANTQPAA